MIDYKKLKNYYYLLKLSALCEEYFALLKEDWGREDKYNRLLALKEDIYKLMERRVNQ